MKGWRLGIRRPLAERFWLKVDRSAGPNGCWLWLGGLRNGYGQVCGERRDRHGKSLETLYAHRLAWTLLRGQIPPGMTLDHYRRNAGPRQAPCAKLCVNPAHLEVVTHGENAHRGGGRPKKLPLAA